MWKKSSNEDATANIANSMLDLEMKSLITSKIPISKFFFKPSIKNSIGVLTCTSPCSFAKDIFYSRILGVQCVRVRDVTST